MNAVHEPVDAKAKILAVACRLFAQRGVGAVSLRELTAQAGVNIAAVNYHFGSRSGLEEALFEDLAIRVNRQRLSELNAVLKTAAGAGVAPRTEDILETFIAPYLSADDAGEGHLLAQLILKHRLEPSALTIRLMRTHFDPMAKKYVEAFALANPEIDAEEFVWRYMFMTSAVVLTATDRHKNNRVRTISSGRLDATDAPGLRAALLRFLIGGMTAPEVDGLPTRATLRTARKR